MQRGPGAAKGVMEEGKSTASEKNKVHKKNGMKGKVMEQKNPMCRQSQVLDERSK